MAPTSALQAYRKRAAELETAANKRTICIINSTIGETRQFGGKIVLEHEPASTAGPRALVYYSDGSVHKNGWGFNDMRGAGVAWKDREEELEEGEISEAPEPEWHGKRFELGLNIGDSADTELFAAAAALGLAIQRVQQGEACTLVRVYTDCQRILLGIKDGSIVSLGPAVKSVWALQELYDGADWLREQGVGVKLMWVKGHNGDKGNEIADTAAGSASRAQIKELGKVEEKRKMVRKRDVPEDVNKAGEDAVEEWYWRVNKHFLLAGEKEEEDVGVDDDNNDLSNGSQAMDTSDSDNDSS
jgi:ribonuclease HI